MLYAISMKNNDPNSIKSRKPNFGPDLGSLGLNSGRQLSFFKYLSSSVTRYHGQLSSCTISEKANDTILRKLSDRETEGQING